MPNSYMLIQAKDIPGKNQLEDFPLPVLARERLSYIGEPVALLIGPDEAKLEEYAALCKVLVDEEYPVFSGASLPRDAVLAKRTLTLGNPERAFENAAMIIEGSYKTGIQEHWYSEPVGALAVFSHDKAEPRKTGGSILIHTATQWPFHVRKSVAGVLNVDAGRVVVEPSRIGIHLDGKIWYPSLVACHAALGALISGKPVKIVLTREEDFRYSPKRNGAEIHISSAMGGRGELLGTEIEASAFLGAHGVFTDEILDRTCLGALGIYKHVNVGLRGHAWGTNIPPGGPLAGFGLAQGFFAMERHVSHIADTLKQDPVEWRKNHMFSRNGSLAIGMGLKDHIPLEELLDTASAMSDYHRKWASYELLRDYHRTSPGFDQNDTLRGIGIAAAYQGSGFLYNGSDKGIYWVELTMEKDGSLEIKTSMVSSNDEHPYIWRHISAELLSMEMDMIRVRANGTDRVPDSGPSSLSRNVTVITKLVERACAAIRKQRFRDPLPITVRRSCHPLKAPGWEERPYDQTALSHLGWGAAVVEVEIDPVEYIPKIRGAWLGVDGGKILSEARARRSLKFSIIQALGWASRENLAYEEGQIPLKYIYDYDIPSPQDIPPIFIDFLWTDTVNPKGIGELPFNCIPAAYVQAVSQAMDHHFEKIPLTSKDIWEAGKLKEQEKVL
jgi:CO/xanthine dehydrogenase Mo-binding subunit